MIARRNLLTLFRTGIATGWIGLSQNESRVNGYVPSDDQKVATLNPCLDTFADPPWKRLSSASGDLPVPQTSDQQTGSVVGDIDGDGRLDFAITNRRHGKAAIWMQNTGHGWTPHVIDPGLCKLK